MKILIQNTHLNTNSTKDTLPKTNENCKTNKKNNEKLNKFVTDISDTRKNKISYEKYSTMCDQEDVLFRLGWSFTPISLIALGFGFIMMIPENWNENLRAFLAIFGSLIITCLPLLPWLIVYIIHGKRLSGKYIEMSDGKLVKFS